MNVLTVAHYVKQRRATRRAEVSEVIIVAIVDADVVLASSDLDLRLPRPLSDMRRLSRSFSIRSKTLLRVARKLISQTIEQTNHALAPSLHRRVSRQDIVRTTQAGPLENREDDVIAIVRASAPDI